MPPELAGASPEPKIVQGFADFHVSLPLISKFSGLGDNSGVNISQFSGYDVLWSPWFRGRRGGSPGQGNQMLSDWAVKTFVRYSVLRAAVRRSFLMPSSLEVSFLSKFKAVHLRMLKFSAAWPWRMRDWSSLKLTSSCQWSRFSIDQ